jgi:hypothetical protein
VRAGYRRNDGPGDRFLDYVSDVLVFTSSDGRRYEFQQVLAAGSPDGVHSDEDPRVQRVSSAGTERVAMSYTNLPTPESGLPWRVGVHRLAYAGGRFRLNPRSGRVVGPDGVKDKDAVIFNLRDGRVGLIHRIHPNMQLALFDSLDELCYPARDDWETNLRDLEQHVLIRPAEGALGVGAGAPPVATQAGLLLFFHERETGGRYTTKVALLDYESGASGRCYPARSCDLSCRGSASATSTTSSSSKARCRDPTARSTSPTAQPTAASARRAWPRARSWTHWDPPNDLARR